MICIFVLKGSLFHLLLACCMQFVVCPEAVKLDDLDSSAISSQYEAAKTAYNSAAAGSVEQAEAQIDMETNKSMGLALGMNLS